jgi:hypothetical protein
MLEEKPVPSPLSISRSIFTGLGVELGFPSCRLIQRISTQSCCYAQLRNRMTDMTLVVGCRWLRIESLPNRQLVLKGKI